METELRRRRSELLTLGYGIIAFGLWSVLKTYLYTWVDPIIREADVTAENRTAAAIVAYIMITMVLAVDFGLRLYVGMSARAEGMGKKKGRGYIVVAALMLLISVLLWFLSLGYIQSRAENESLMDYIISMVVDLTSIAILARLVYNAVKVRQLRRELEG